MPDTPDLPDRLVTALWLRHGQAVPQRPDESLSDYVRRLRAMTRQALPEPIHRCVVVMRHLLSATVLADVLPVRFGDLMPPEERN
jgi:hypothetical protein